MIAMGQPNVQDNAPCAPCTNLSPCGATEAQCTDALVDLLSRCALRDQTAFVSLYEATSAKLYAIALRVLKSEHWAEEALQEACLKIWNHAGSYNESKGRPMTWMINIVRNQALDMLRKPQYREEFGNREPEPEHSTHENDPVTHTEVNDGLAQLVSYMQHLREEQRRCILLIYHQGFTPTEIARREGRPVATVKTWVRRGLITIRERMLSCDVLPAPQQP